MIRNPTIVPGTIPVLSLWEPWASLCVWAHTHGDPFGKPVAEKQYETRSWQTSYRGPVVIHASKKWSPELADICRSDPFWRVIKAHTGVSSRGLQPKYMQAVLADKMPFGALIGTACITGCASTSEYPEVWGSPPFVETNEYAFGDYRPGRYAIRLSNPVAFARPIPFVGRQGWFNVEEGVIG